MSASMSVRVSKPEYVSSVAVAIASKIVHPLIKFLIFIDPTFLMFSQAFQVELLVVDIKMQFIQMSRQANKASLKQMHVNNCLSILILVKMALEAIFTNLQVKTLVVDNFHTFSMVSINQVVKKDSKILNKK
jgi:phosphorylcholine metabolism protein LicD